MKVGIIGLGSIGKRHADNLKSLGYTVMGCDRVMGYDPDMKRQLDAIGIPWDKKEIIELSDAFIIASPSSLHFQHIQELIETRKPILVEKPIAYRKVELDILAECESAGALDKLFIGYNLRYLPIIKTIKEWVDSGELGDIVWGTFVCGQKNEKPQYLRDGVILNWSHEIDIALHILGEAYVINASVTDIVADVYLQHRGGGRSFIHVDYIADPWIRKGSITGTKGVLKYDILAGTATMELYNMTGGSGKMFCSDMAFEQCYVYEIEDFLVGRGCSAKEGLDALDICFQAINASRRTSRHG
jgi:predicted dehydrogenase